MEIVKRVAELFKDRTSSSSSDDLPSEWLSDTSSDWKTEAWFGNSIKNPSETVYETIAGWIGLALPRRVTIIQDLDPSTVFALEVCKVVPPEWIGVLAILGLLFLMVLGVYGLRVAWRLLTCFARARSRRAMPVSSAPHSARRQQPSVSAEVAAVLAAINANNSTLATRTEERVSVHRRRRTQ